MALPVINLAIDGTWFKSPKGPACRHETDSMLKYSRCDHEKISQFREFLLFP